MRLRALTLHLLRPQWPPVSVGCPVAAERKLRSRDDRQPAATAVAAQLRTMSPVHRAAASSWLQLPTGLNESDDSNAPISNPLTIHEQPSSVVDTKARQRNLSATIASPTAHGNLRICYYKEGEISLVVKALCPGSRPHEVNDFFQLT
jgi:hypothetical protein